jgi:lysozyme family protein
MLNRRCFLASSSALIASTGFASPLFAQEAPADWRVPNGPLGRTLSTLQERAGAAGLARQQQKAARAFALTEDYDALLPDVVDLIDALEQAQPGAASGEQSREIEALLGETTELLGALARRERMALTYNPDDKAVRKIPSYEELRDGYLELFDASTILPSRKSVTNWYIYVLNRPKNRQRYEEVGQRLNIPWYFLGITHALEGSFNFRAHIHNGDPLRSKTIHVPRGRPVPWSPPNDWVSSAIDAMQLKKFHLETDWSLAHLLYRFEAYNGFGYRGRGINTPYLWSFSNHYTKGKYVSDGHFDRNAVSNQCGAAVLVKALADRSIIELPVKV